MKSFSQNLKLVKLFSVFFLIILFTNSYSQGSFLHKGQSGIQFDGFYLQSKKQMYIENQGITESRLATQSGFGGKVGFSIKGRFDIQASGNSWTLENSSINPESKGSTVAIRAVIHLMKQSDKVPFSVRAIVGYGTTEYNDISTMINDTHLGLGIYRRIYFHDNFSIIPTFDYIYNRSVYSFEDVSDKDESRSIFAISLPIAYNLPHNHLIHFAPFVNSGMSESGGSMGFNLGYIIPFYSRNK